MQNNEERVSIEFLKNSLILWEAFPITEYKVQKLKQLENQYNIAQRKLDLTQELSSGICYVILW